MISTPAPASSSPWIERALALAAALLTFQVYMLTIYPGLFGVGDAAKFSFVGKVLGTPHSPGYPMYVMVSHLFSYVPIGGSLAFRMNVLSALLAAVAVYLLYFAARALGTRPAVALSAAIALGLGRSFWDKAQYAKGYTLTAALVCAGILLLLRWSQSGRRSHFYGAIAVFAIAVGNHLIIVALVPALLLHALLTNARLAVAPRTLVFAAALLTVGFSQYSLILIRTWQGAPYLEARAETVSELVDVVTARRYAHEIGAYQIGDVVRTRVPIVAGLVERELTWPGLILVAIGTVALARKRVRDALLCLVGAAGVIALTANMSSDEDEGFLLSAFVLLWLLAAMGMEAIWPDRRRQGEGGRWRPAVALLITIGVPVSLVAANYRANDHHRRTFEIRYFKALFDFLPDKSAIVLDKYPTNMMIDYKLMGEGAAAGRTIWTVWPVPARVAEVRKQGFRVFLFDESRLELAKFDFRVKPISLKAEPFSQFLRSTQEGLIVVVAATPVAAAGLMSDPQAWSRIGVPEGHVFRRVGAPYAAIGVGGARSGALEAADRPDRREVDLTVASGSPVGATGVLAPTDIRATADGHTAAIWAGGKELVRSKDGAVVAVVGPRGVVESFVLDLADGFRVPIDMSHLPLFELPDAGTCVNLGNLGWRDISTVPIDGRVMVRIDNYRPFLSRSTFYVVSDRPAAPTMAAGPGAGVPAMAVSSFRLADAAQAAALKRSLADDKMTMPLAASGGTYVSRVEMTVNDNGDYKATMIAFGVPVAQTFARITVDLNNELRATVCGAPPS